MPPQKHNRTPRRPHKERSYNEQSYRVLSEPARQKRIANCPKPNFPPELPISVRQVEIIEAIRRHPTLIVCGETGSGKTTQLPKLCLKAGRGIDGIIGHTQPRRIAARTVAARIATELKTELGYQVGFKVRFQEHIHPDCYIKLMTDGILLAEIQGDRWLQKYDTLIIDEAHERSLTIDFLLGYLKHIQAKRTDLRLIITSATIDPERFSQHFNHAPIIEVSGRSHPVEVRYRPLQVEDEEDQDRDAQQAVLDAVDELIGSQGQISGDILIFQSGEREILDLAEALRKHRLQNTEILPLYARIGTAEQARIFRPGKQRRIILATNVAETSLTVPGIRFVIDPGFARISRYSHRNRVQRLPIERIAKANAEQRKGRCGRTSPGICIRLYSEEDFQQRPNFSDPEILRTHLAAVILRMYALNLPEIEAFPFIEPPEARMIRDGRRLLEELGALQGDRLNELGQQMSRMTIDPRLARILLAAKEQRCLEEALVLTAVLSIQDPRERPMDAQQAADQQHRTFQDQRSDFMGYLKLWDFYEEQRRHLTQNKLRKLCRERFISFVRMREWHELYRQLKGQIANLPTFRGQTIGQAKAGFAEIHRALLSGLLSQIGFLQEKQCYQGARGIQFYLFPGSGLFSKGPKWVVTAELVETSRLYARRAAKVEPEWIEEVAGTQLKRHYFEPHWQKKSGRVGGFEKVALYGLILQAKRPIDYGPIDPVLCRRLFIRHALIYGEYQSRAAFFLHNRALIEGVQAMEHRIRRRDILVNEEQLERFFDQRLPSTLHDGPSFEHWRKKAEQKQPKLLFLRQQDLIESSSETPDGDCYPTTLQIGEVALTLEYCFEPGEEEDGVTVRIPLLVLHRLRPASFEWLVPGLLTEKIVASLKALPKRLRRNFVPIPEYAKACVAAMEPENRQEPSLYKMLSTQLHRMTGVQIQAEDWRAITLPPHLRMGYRIVEKGRVVAWGRDLLTLQQTLGKQHPTQLSHKKTSDTTKNKRYTNWDFGTLPEQITIQCDGVQLSAYPALVDVGQAVTLVEMDSLPKAIQSTRKGQRRLYLLQLRKEQKALLKEIPDMARMAMYYQSLPVKGIKTTNSQNLAEDLLGAAVERELLPAQGVHREKEAFNKTLQIGRGRLFGTTGKLGRQIAEMFSTHKMLRGSLNGKPPSTRQYAYQDMQAQLTKLVFQGFVVKTPVYWLEQLPRYLHALQLRLQKLEQDPGQDQRHHQQIAPFLDCIKNDEKSDQENPDWVQFRWMLEEMRVSLYAQQLKTAIPVSIKRLERQWRKVEEMDL